MYASEVTLFLMFPFGAVWGFALCNLLNSRRSLKSPKVSQESYDRICKQRDECLEGWNKTIDSLNKTTESLNKSTDTLDKTIADWGVTTAHLEDAIAMLKQENA